MTTITTIDTPKTMTSREIAALTGKQHRNVTRDVLNLLIALEIDALSFEQTYTDAGNRKQTEYILPKRETLILVAGCCQGYDGGRTGGHGCEI